MTACKLPNTSPITTQPAARSDTPLGHKPDTGGVPQQVQKAATQILSPECGQASVSVMQHSHSRKPPSNGQLQPLDAQVFHVTQPTRAARTGKHAYQNTRCRGWHCGTAYQASACASAILYRHCAGSSLRCSTSDLAPSSWPVSLTGETLMKLLAPAFGLTALASTAI